MSAFSRLLARQTCGLVALWKSIWQTGYVHALLIPDVFDLSRRRQLHDVRT